MDNTKIMICHIITRMDKGGAPDIVRILFDKFDFDKFDLTLIYGKTLHPSRKTQEFLERITDRAIQVPSLQRDVNPIKDLIAFFKILSLLRKNKFDIVHTHTAKAGVLGRIAATLAGARCILHSPHGHDFYGYFGFLASRLIIWIERFAGLFCDKIHALTELEKNDMLHFRICPAEKIEVIYSGIEPSFYKADEVSRRAEKNEFLGKEDKFLVGMVGRLEPVKGPQYFIEAALLSAEKIKNAKFLVVGEGSLRGSLEKRVRDAKLEGKFIFTGWREDVPDIYPLLDILVLPSLNEAVGRSVLEAQANGVPVVATRVGGVPEVIKDKETGVLVAPCDPEALAEQIIYLLEHEPIRKKMSEAARLWVNERFSDARMVESFAGLYKKMINT